eukprot:3940433-Rhodomonas_salina.1
MTASCTPASHHYFSITITSATNTTTTTITTTNNIPIIPTQHTHILLQQQPHRIAHAPAPSRHGCRRATQRDAAPPRSPRRSSSPRALSASTTTLLPLPPSASRCRPLAHSTGRRPTLSRSAISAAAVGAGGRFEAGSGTLGAGPVRRDRARFP